MKCPNHDRRRRTVLTAALAVVPIIASRHAVAATKYYVGPASGSWSSTTSWSATLGGTAGAPVPVTGDLVYLTNTTGLVQTINYNVSGVGVNLGSLALDATGGSGAGNDTLFVPGNSLSIAGPLSIGNNGSGTLNQTAGTITANLIYIGYNGGNGAYQMVGGTLNSTSADSSGNSEYVGYNAGPGSFTQTGGTHNVSGNIIIGNTNSSSGTYTLSSSAAKLTVSGNEYVAYSASNNGIGGEVYQSAGTHIINGSLVVGELSTATGYFELTGGTLQEGSTTNAFAAGETVGDIGYGDINQFAASNTVGTATAGQVLTVGNFGIGEYDMYSGATLTVNGNEIVSRYNGSYGTFYQTAGTHTVSGFLSIGDLNGSTGTLFLEAGTLNVGASSTVAAGSEYNNYEIIGAAGSGTLTQTGGVNTVGSPSVSQHLEIGYAINGTTGIGTYSLGTGSVLNVYGSEYIGDGAAGTATQSGGTFNQSGGTHNVSAGLYVANGSGATGTFNLFGGTLTANQEFVAIGGGAYGVFTQIAGTNTILTTGLQPGLFIGLNSGDYGVYTMNGSGAVLAAYNLALGGSATSAGGTGILNIESGTVTAAQQLIVWNTPNTGIIFSGGYLTVGSINTEGNPTNFQWTGGTLTITSPITVDSNFGLGPTIALNTGMSLVTTGSLTNNGTINLAGGSFNAAGPVVNNALIAGYGTIITSGSFTNNLQITQAGGNLTLISTGTALNAGTITLATGHSFVLGSTAMANTGAINLNGGGITGTGTLTNSIGGTVSGPGLLNIPFSSSGVVTPGTGTLNVLSAWTNSGVVELAGLTSTITGGAISNSATIQGYGNIGSSIANTGTIEAIGGTLVIGALTNPAAGMLQSALGGKLLVASGLVTNAGLISLTGGTFDNGGFPLTNTGQITGYGGVSTGGLTNAGRFTLSGTSTNATNTVNGNVTNNVGQLITIQNQPAIFTGNIVNNGTIITFSTTVTFGGSYSGNAYISDPSSNIFESSVTVVTGGSMTGSTGDSFTFLTGTVTNNGTFANGGRLFSGDNFTNNGTFNQSGSQTWEPGTVFINAAGTALFASDAGGGGQNLSVNVSGGTAAFSTTQHLSALTIGGGTTAKITGGGTGHRSLLFTPFLSDAGTLDLTTNDLDYQSAGSAGLGAVTQLIASGYNGGNWTGTGITSSSAASDSSHLTAVGVILNSFNGSTPLYTSFDGTTVALNDVLAKDTYYGDANLDGKVDGTDYSRIDNGYLLHLNGWYNGDFNYDSVINGSDYTLIDNAFNMQGVQLSAVVDSQVNNTESVPEPAALAMVGIGFNWPSGPAAFETPRRSVHAFCR